jgi:hypothetical protein
LGDSGSDEVVEGAETLGRDEQELVGGVGIIGGAVTLG